MKKFLLALFVLVPALASAQIAPYPLGVTPPIFGLPSVNGGNITPASVGVNASTCAAPGIYLITAPTNGIAFTATPSVIICVNGTAILTSTATAVTSGVPILGLDGTATAVAFGFNDLNSGLMQRADTTVGVALNGMHYFEFQPAALVMSSGTSINWASGVIGSSLDVSLSRWQANGLRLATGDSFNIESGGLGVGVVETDAGEITTSGQITGVGIVSTGSVSAAAGSAYRFTGRSALQSAANGKFNFATDNTTSGILSEQFTDNPTCATNCGTSPTLAGVDSSFTLTMGASGVPASGFIVTFNGTWAAAPQCTASMGLAGMVVGKLPLTVVTTTTTATFTTNGTAPATSDVYHVRCSLGQ